MFLLLCIRKQILPVQSNQDHGQPWLKYVTVLDLTLPCLILPDASSGSDTPDTLSKVKYLNPDAGLAMLFPHPVCRVSSLPVMCPGIIWPFRIHTALPTERDTSVPWVSSAWTWKTSDLAGKSWDTAVSTSWVRPRPVYAGFCVCICSIRAFV